MKILIFGASGSGTTTLGKELELKFDFVHLDADDYYWKATQPPFQEKISLSERNKTLTKDFKKNKNVIISGSMVSWGEEWKSAFDLAIFIYLRPKIRIERLKEREKIRLGDKLLTDKQTQESSVEFIEWAKKYDDPNFLGRSLKVHNDWIKLLKYPVIRIDGEMNLTAKVKKVLSELKIINRN
ncbi:AAA family ATPase [Aquimarina sp. 2201CG5-10]|uniref:AAA family ATPase n=1 Tax=Aquimarina callyspongiae TaxID=3098150 RepID=UPI002AB4859C|nr:AAA family ATPase [Aquimarina sp. 2201CG5-10]MDY8135371.1 AAA family ATPase [Aquimarina sp. 2201CG5-10]